MPEHDENTLHAILTATFPELSEEAKKQFCGTYEMTAQNRRYANRLYELYDSSSTELLIRIIVEMYNSLIVGNTQHGIQLLRYES